MTTYSTGETIQTGDVVRVGKGKADWTIMGIPGRPTRDGVSDGYRVSGPHRNMFIPADEHARLSLVRAWVPCGAVYDKHTHPFTCTLAPSDHTAHEDHKTDAPAVVCWEESVCSHSWTEASATGRKCGACGEPVTPEVEASEAPAAPIAVGDTVRTTVFGRPLEGRVSEIYEDGSLLVVSGAIMVVVTDWQRVTPTPAAYDPNTDGLPDPDNAEQVAAWLAFTPTEQSARAAAVAMDEAFAEFDAKQEAADDDDVERCPVCGEPSDYCQGHGEIGDHRRWEYMIAHDHGDHIQCHPAGCEAAGTSEHVLYPHHVGYLDSCAACVTGACVCCESDSLAPCVSSDCEAREMEGDDVEPDTEAIEREHAYTSGLLADEPEDTGETYIGRDGNTYNATGVARGTRVGSIAERGARGGFRGGLAVVVGLLWVLAGLFTLAGVQAPAAYASPEVTEDDDAWNCATMGDHECGPRPAVLPTVPVHCLALPGRPGNTRYVMVAPVAGLIVGCQA